MQQLLSGSVGRSQPSFRLFQHHEEQHAHQDDEADCRVSSCKIITLGQIVDELAESAVIYQKFDAHDVDQREDQPQPYADGSCTFGSAGYW